MFFPTYCTTLTTVSCPVSVRIDLNIIENERHGHIVRMCYCDRTKPEKMEKYIFAENMENIVVVFGCVVRAV